MSVEALSGQTKLKIPNPMGRLLVYEGFWLFLQYSANISKVHTNKVPPSLNVPASPYTECAVACPLVFNSASSLAPPPQRSFTLTWTKSRFVLAVSSHSLPYPNKANTELLIRMRARPRGRNVRKIFLRCILS